MKLIRCTRTSPSKHLCESNKTVLHPQGGFVLFTPSSIFPSFRQIRGSFGIIFGMSSKLKSFLLIALYALLLSVGCWFSFRVITNPLPNGHEAPHLFTTARSAESLTPPAVLPPERVASSTPFHRLAAVFVQFFGVQHGTEYSLRTYRLFPMVLAVLLLSLIPALGLKRRGGLLGTEDSPFWVALFIAVAPAFFDFGRDFIPLTFQLLLFLLLLISARAYVQWPGYASAAILGALMALTILADTAALWLLVILIPTVCIGVGWRRLCLYWHTGHVLTLVGVIPLFVALGVFFDWNAPLVYPSLTAFWPHLKNHALHHILWYGLGGFGLLAWLIVILRLFRKHDKRWEKVIAILFPLCGITAFAFPEGSIFTASWIIQSALLISFLLSEFRWLWVRLLLGCSTVTVLGFGMFQLTARHQQYDAVANTSHTLQTLADLLRKTGKTPPRVTLFSNDPVASASLMWLLRSTQLLPISEMQHADLRFIDGGTLTKGPPTPSRQTLATLVLPPDHLFYCLPKQDLATPTLP